MFYFGLFGFDLKEFWADCDLSENCDYKYLDKNFDGWAVGAYARTAIDLTLAGLSKGICVDYTEHCFGFYTRYDSVAQTYHLHRLAWDNGGPMTTTSPAVENIVYANLATYEMKTYTDG